MTAQSHINAMVTRAFSALDVLNNLGTTHYRDRLFQMCEEEERQHRRFAPDGTIYPKGASVPAAARFFAVKYLVEAVLGQRFDISDVIHLRPSVVYAQSVAVNYQKEIRHALKDMELRELVALDYCELVGSK